MPNTTINANISTQAAASELGNSGTILFPNGNYPYSSFGYDQFNWFLNDIARVNRAVTPWVIVAWHQPPYNSYSTHYKEFECGRQQIEPYLYANGVDIVLHGAACRSWDPALSIIRVRVRVGKCSRGACSVVSTSAAVVPVRRRCPGWLPLELASCVLTAAHRIVPLAVHPAVAGQVHVLAHRPKTQCWTSPLDG